MIIVIAWADMTGARNTGEYERFDGCNFRPKFAPEPKGYACTWTLDGTEADLANAEAYRAKDLVGQSQFSAVYTFPESEDEPLRKARAQAAAALAALNAPQPAPTANKKRRTR